MSLGAQAAVGRARHPTSARGVIVIVVIIIPTLIVIVLGLAIVSS